ncbi:hypothetical protein EFK68_02825 [Pseudomonas aeruginosa]|nr:hypothetical protein EFK68_02825 [Pseudomonas aeruginosa]
MAPATYPGNIMKTEAANDFSQHILAEVKRLEDLAKSCAVQYAETDSAESKASFQRYSFAAAEMRKLHGPACQAFHAVEALIPAGTKLD